MRTLNLKNVLIFGVVILWINDNVFVQAVVGGPTSSTMVLSCGSDTDRTDAEGQKWDADAKFLTSDPKNASPAKAQFQDPSLPSEIPYMSARVILDGEASYKFPVSTTNRYFLRLHFYPAAYTKSDSNTHLSIDDSYFSATVNGITLLNNFSATITADALTQAYIIREFSLSAMGSDSLTLTLKPSDKHPRAFAFINGIELVPEAADLFATPANLVGYDDQSVDTSTCHLQTMVRLNVGGSFIAPANDSGGMLRTWYDDTPYLAGANAGVTSPNGGANITLTFPNPSSKVAAPIHIYQTWRNMGPDPKLTRQYNLTWNFQVSLPSYPIRSISSSFFLYIFIFHI